MTKIAKIYWGIAIFCGAFPALAAFVFAGNQLHTDATGSLLCGGGFWIAAAIFVFGILCGCNSDGDADERMGVE